jgi:hypothetical protein
MSTKLWKPIPIYQSLHFKLPELLFEQKETLGFIYDAVSVCNMEVIGTASLPSQTCTTNRQHVLNTHDSP